MITKEVQNKLAELGLSEPMLLEIAMKGHAARTNATEDDPSNAGGTMAYFAMVRAKRHALCPLGWEKDEVKGLPRTTNPETGVTLIISCGDKEVGIENGHPKTKNAKGPQAEFYISQNHQMDLFAEDLEKHVIKQDSNQQTWVLLHHFDAKNNEIRIELSLPTEMDENHYISGWEQRLILPPINLNNPLSPSDTSSSSEYQQELDIPVKRRQT